MSRYFYRNDKFKDDWRYNPIGPHDFILEKELQVNPEDSIIDAIDNNDLDEMNNVYTRATVEGTDFESDEMIRLIEQLPEIHQVVLYAYYYSGRTMPEIAKERGVSKQYIWQELRTGRKRLKALIEETGYRRESV